MNLIGSDDDEQIMLMRAQEEAANNILRNAKEDIFSSQLKIVGKIRKRERKKKKLNAVDRKTLCDIYGHTSTLALVACHDLFRKHVLEKEIEVWFDHVADILQQKINDIHWIKTGTLLYHDMALFCSFGRLVNHPLPAAMTFESTKILEIVVSMMMKRKGDSEGLPGPEFAKILVNLMFGLRRCGTEYFDNAWKPYSIFKKLEATGILEQFLRCATIQFDQTSTGTNKKKEFLLVGLLRCTKFVRKHLKEGTPCGDTLRAIFDKRDASTTICSHALPFLQSLVKLSNTIQIVDCQYCKKGGLRENYMRCGACRQTNYCCKACQAADWKQHKTTCATESFVDSNDNPTIAKSVIVRILGVTYVETMVRLVDECDKAGVEMQDMVLEIQLFPDGCGRIPLLQDPPEFQIIPVARYLDGSRYREKFAEEDYFVAEKINLRVEELVNELSQYISNRTKPRLLGFIYDSHCFGKRYFQLWTEDGEPMFTQEAVEAFRAALLDDDYSHLADVFASQERIERYANQIRILKRDRAANDTMN